MPTPLIRIDQATLAAGTGGVSRTDGVIGQLVTLSVTNFPPESAFVWTVLAKPEGETANLSSSTAASPTFTPTVAGSWLFEVAVDVANLTYTVLDPDGEATHVSTQGGFAVRMPDGTRIPAPGETAQFDGYQLAMAEFMRAQARGRCKVGTKVGALAAAVPGETVTLLPGTHTLGAVGADDPALDNPATTIKFMQGAILSVTQNRTIACRLDFSEGGQIKPSSGAVTAALTGRINLSPNHYAFDVSAGGLFTFTSRCIDRLTPYNFGAAGDDVSYDDVPFAACVRACGSAVASAVGGIEVYLPPGEFRLGSVLTTDSRGDKVGITIPYDYLEFRGCGERLSQIHWIPNDAATSVMYYCLRWETADPAQPLQSPAFSGISFSGGGGGNDARAKTALDFHDVRNLRCNDIWINNWNDLTSRSVGIRLRGRDNNHIVRPKTTTTDIPFLFWYNDNETQALDGNGVPTVFRDNGKDNDQTFITDANLACTEVRQNPYRAAVLFAPGTVARNTGFVAQLEMVGGGLVWVDRKDGATQTVSAVDSGVGVDTLTVTTHPYANADRVRISSTGTIPGGLAANTDYYVIVIGASTIKLATSPSNALAGTAIDLTSNGSGTITLTGKVYGGAAIEPRRSSNQCAIGHGRVEGVENATPDDFAIRIEKHANAPLRELAIKDFFFGAGSDARYSVNTGGSQFTGAGWGGLRAKGTERVDIGANCRFGGTTTPVDVDVDCKFNIHPTADLVPSDNKRFIPEHESHWDLLTIARPRHWWINTNASPAQLGDVQDEATSGVTDIKLDPGGSPGYQQLRPGYVGYWTQFTQVANQKFRLNTTDAALDPNQRSVAAFEVIEITAAAGNRHICNLGNATQSVGANGPILRVTSAGKLEIVCAGVINSGGLNYIDGQAFAYWFAYNRTRGTVKVWTRKADGTGEVITGTYAAAVGNDVNKGYGAGTASVDSYAGYSRWRAWFVNSAAEQDGHTVLRKLGWKSSTDADVVLATEIRQKASLPVRFPEGAYIADVADWNVVVATDGPTPVKLPGTDLEWVKAALPVPNAWWKMQASASPVTNESDDTRFDLVANGSPDYAQALGGWTGNFIKFTETANERLELSSDEFNPATGSVAALVYARIGTVGGDRVLTMLGSGSASGGGGGQLVRFNSAGNARTTVNGTDNTGTYVYEADGLEHAFLLVWNFKKRTIRLITDQETIEGTYSATITNASTKGFGGVGGLLPPECWLRFGAWWYGTKAEEIDALGRRALARLGWFAEAPQEASFSPGDIEGLSLSRTSASTLTVASGGCRASNNLMDLKVLTSTVVDISASGAGGLDTGSEAANTWYAVYLIGDTTESNGTVAMLSTSSSSPTLPAGYDCSRHIGWWRNGATDFMFLSQRGSGKTRTYYWDEARATCQVLTDGAATSFTDVDLSSRVPPGCDLAIVQPALAVPTTTGTNTDGLELRMNGANSSDGPWRFQPGIVMNAAGGPKMMFAPVEIPTDANRVIEYRVSDTDDRADLYVIGFDHET